MRYRFMAIQTTTRCTLKCKYCSISYHKFNPPQDSSFEVICLSMEKIFQILDFTSEFRIAGAEAFLYPQIIDVVSEAVKYKNQFDFINIVTNGTYVPDRGILKHIQKQGCRIMVRIDNYGGLSSKLSELIAELKLYGIEYEVRDNYGDNQFCGGWIDFGIEYEHKNYTDADLTDIFEVCNNRVCPLVWDGIWYACSFCAGGHLLGKIPIAKRDYVNLLSDIPVDEMRKIVEDFPKIPYEGCKYCNGFDVKNSPRIPAAEQTI